MGAVCVSRGEGGGEGKGDARGELPPTETLSENITYMYYAVQKL